MAKYKREVTHYTQCELRREDGPTCFDVHVAWIPSGQAVYGNTLRIDGLDGKWVVVARYETKTADQVEEKSRDHLHQREASDI